MQDLKVLVLEDEPFQRLVAVTALEKLLPGQVLEATNGHEALQVLSEGPVDIAVCDLKMTGMDGLAFLRHASASGNLRAVVLCSELEPVLRQATISMIGYLGLAFLGDLGKPFNLERFASLVSRYQASRTSAAQPLERAELPSLADVQRGLDNAEFEAYYQPKVTLEGPRLVGAELLARWNHPQWGVLTPAHFLPVMERHNLLEQLFWQMFEQGLTLGQQLGQQGLSVNLAFNLHPSLLERKGLSEHVSQLLMRFRTPAASIMLEITESAVISAPASSLENLVRLRILGCGLAMDDFGAGYSSLDRLSELPFSQIKLDRAFVNKLLHQPRSGAIISCSVALARALDISLVVEGVETPEQQRRLLELGCSIAQGFLFARPMPGSHFIDYCVKEAAASQFKMALARATS